MMIQLDPNIFDGYLSEENDGVWISAIKARKIGNGDFKRLINDLKQKYSWIKIPTPSNIMVQVSTHLGFKIKEEYFGYPFNEMGIVMYWEKGR